MGRPFVPDRDGQKKKSDELKSDVNMILFHVVLSLPDTNAGLDRFSVFHLRLLLCKNLFDGVCILEHDMHHGYACQTLLMTSNMPRILNYTLTLNTCEPGSL